MKCECCGELIFDEGTEISPVSLETSSFVDGRKPCVVERHEGDAVRTDNRIFPDSCRFTQSFYTPFKAMAFEVSTNHILLTI